MGESTAGASQASGRSGSNVATPARRLVAALIDWVLVGVALYVFGSAVAEPLGLDEEAAALAAFAAVLLAYYAGTTWLMGATPGKVFVGIEVVRPDGAWPGAGRSVLRFALWACLPVLSWAFVLSRHRRGIHDQIADTYVVRAR